MPRKSPRPAARKRRAKLAARMAASRKPTHGTPAHYPMAGAALAATLALATASLHRRTTPAAPRSAPPEPQVASPRPLPPGTPS